MHTSSQGTNFEYDGWNVQIMLAWDSFARRYSARAELFLDGAFRCRISLRDAIVDEGEIISSLRERATAFIDDWRRRAHDADSEFAEL
jgi:hypothetical protein